MLSATEILAVLAGFASDTRLIELSWPDGDDTAGSLTVEAFAADERLQGIAWRDVLVLSANRSLGPAVLLNRRACLEISLADRSRARFSGVVSEVQLLGRHGRLARYRLRLSSWLWRLTQTRNCRVWQDKSVIDIVDEVFGAYLPLARWRWSAEVANFLAEVPKRAYCCQYRESDADFITRLLGEEGLAWRSEDDKDGQQLVLFADSSRRESLPRDPSCMRRDGIRYHQAHAGEAHDAIQWAAVLRRLIPGSCTMLTWNEEAKRNFSASAASRVPLANGKSRGVEQFSHPGNHVFGNPGEALHYASLRMEAHDVRACGWTLRSTVRTWRAGVRFTMRDCPYPLYGEPELVTERVSSLGFNNLPDTVSAGVGALFGPADAVLASAFDGYRTEVTDAVFAQARLSGYANCALAFDAAMPWRPLADLERAKPTAQGSQSATVIGPDGSDHAGDVHCDALGRVRIRFHWQSPADNGSCWVRVSQRSAGAGMGSQFLPRIGQEVMVQFLHNDIDRPVIVGALYNGVGEGGIAPTPGGRAGMKVDPGVFAQADDQCRAGQGNLAGGNSPVWHGASPSDNGHRNAAAQWGIRSKEFGVEGSDAGYNQLLFDDTDGQGRVQLRCTHAGTELNMGHLIHTADNYRGSVRGSGIELRTDDYGCVRAGAGLLISSYGIKHSADERDPAGDNQPGVALIKSAITMAEAFSKAAVTHQTVGLSSVLGTLKAGASVMDDTAAPLPALAKAMAGMVSSSSVEAALADASSGSTGQGDGKVSHSTAPIIAIAAQAGLGVTAAEDIQLCSGENVTLMSGQDTQFVTGGEMRVHTGQAIGVLGGAVQPGADGIGLQLIAAQGPIDIQAQSDELKIQARDEVSIVSANAHIDWAAAKKISLSTAGGANITIEGGNITVQCPGKLTIHAGKHSLLPPEHLDYPLPKLPRSELAQQPLQFKLRLADTPGPASHPLANTPWKVTYGHRPDGLACVDNDKLLAQGVTDDTGNIALSADEETRLAEVYCAHPDSTWIVYPGHVVSLQVQHESPEWDEKEKLLQAINAADFSPELHPSHLADGVPGQSRYALEALAVDTRQQIYPKIKS